MPLMALQIKDMTTAKSPYELPLTFEIESELRYDDALHEVLKVGKELTQLVENHR